MLEAVFVSLMVLVVIGTGAFALLTVAKLFQGQR